MYKRVELPYIIKRKPAKYDKMLCVGCGKEFTFYAPMVWRKYHNRECYLEHLKNKNNA